MSGVCLSVIIPVYNAEKTLDKCIKSIVCQICKNDIEILLIDDGSTDNSGYMCEKYAKDDSRIKVLHKTNGGVSSARNIGLKCAVGKYLAWVDSDDYVSPNWYKRIRESIEENHDLVLFDYNIVEKNHMRRKSYDNNSGVVEIDKFYKDLAAGKVESHLCTKVFKKSCWEGIMFDEDTSYCEDYRVMHKLSMEISNIRYIHEPLYNYVQREDSIVHDVHKMIDNTLIGIQLAGERMAFFREKGYQVDSLGVYLAIDIFLWSCHKVNGINSDVRDKYDFYMQILKKNILQCLISPRIEWRKKVQMILLVSGVAKRVFSFIVGIRNTWLHLKNIA